VVAVVAERVPIVFLVQQSVLVVAEVKDFTGEHRLVAPVVAQWGEVPVQIPARRVLWGKDLRAGTAFRMMRVAVVVPGGWALTGL